MKAFQRAVAELLPYGLVRRIAAKRTRDRRAKAAGARSRQLRAVLAANGATPERPRLNMGCGTHQEPGWINADADPCAEVPLVVRNNEPLPFPDAELEAVFSEHFLEHLTFEDGRHFLRESGRILRRGGTFRVSCPDLDVIVALLDVGNEKWERLAAIYESIGDFDPGVLDVPERVLNWAFHGHEHKYLWSFRQLSEELRRSGFGNVRRMNFGVSGVDGVAIERRIPEAFYSLIVEGTKE